MKIGKFITPLLIIVISLLLLGPGLNSTASAAMRKTFTPRISIQNQYDDNIGLEAWDENSDWITTVSPGLSLDFRSPRTSMSLDYEAGFSFYRDNSSRDNTRHQGTGLWEQQLSRHLRLEARNTFVRSEDPILVSEGLIEEVFRERRVYHRNNGQVNLLCEFSEKSQMSLGYRNRYLDNQSSRSEDSIGHEGFLDAHTWFGSQFGIGLESLINRGRFKQPEGFDPDDASEDFYQYEVSVLLNYRWHSSRLLYIEYDLLYQDFDEPEWDANPDDFRVHQAGLGLNLSLGPQTQFNVEGGYFVQDPLNDHKRDGVKFDTDLNTRSERISLRIQGSFGYDQDYLSSENLGASRFSQAFGSLDYLLTKNLRFSTSGSYRWVDFFGEDNQDDRDDRKDEVWRMSAGFSFSFWRRLTLSLDASHSERESTDRTVEFRDNRIMLRLTGAYPIIF